MPINNHRLICGLEVHAELKTKSKMFCGCKNDPFFAPEPNCYTCPVCLGMPGGLPVANRVAIEWTIKLGLALNCKINLFSKFDRKHYFYPDLAKGYQISQYDLPFCYDGYLDTSEGRVRIRRIHLEEDTGKLLHQTVAGEKVSLIDFNRSGVPLVEIVTEPDIVSASQAKEYGKKLRSIMRYLNIADCDMEQGGMRLEANISLQNFDQPTEVYPDYKVEVKNINSFRFLEQAIAYEQIRQSHLLNQGQTPTQETRGWNSSKNETFAQRSKESAEDYRYFPDPDLPPFRFTTDQIESFRTQLPELPEQVVCRWEEDYQVEPRFGEKLAITPAQVKLLDQTFQLAVTSKLTCAKLASAVINKKIPFDANSNPESLIQSYNQTLSVDVVDTKELAAAISAVLSAHQAELTRYQAGEVKLFNFFVGQVMRQLGKKVAMEGVRAQLQSQLDQHGQD